MAVGLVVVGMALLYAGGELLVRGAASIARGLGMDPLVIGLTVVAFATSSPELAATLVAAIEGRPEVAIGTVVGSNIANIGLILGLAACTAPLMFRAQFLRREVPVLIIVSFVGAGFMYDGAVTRIEGLLLVILLTSYVGALLMDRSEPSAVSEEFGARYGDVLPRIILSLLGVAVGMGMLVAGAHWLVNGSVNTARSLGVEDRVIGLTVVALGSSLPELAAVLVATLRHQADIAVGNLVGSNFFNLTAVLGGTAIVAPISFPFDAATGDIVVMLLAAVVVWPLLRTDRSMSRWEGALLLTGYGVYVATLFS